MHFTPSYKMNFLYVVLILEVLEKVKENLINGLGRVSDAAALRFFKEINQNSKESWVVVFPLAL